MSIKSKIPQTSLDAYRGLDPGKLREMYVKIVEALSVIKEGNYELIAAQAEEKESRIWKRLSEVRKLGLIHNTGKKIKTKDGCESYIYAIGPGTGNEKPKKERVMKGKTISDFSKAINQVKQSTPSIEKLF